MARPLHFTSYAPHFPYRSVVYEYISNQMMQIKLQLKLFSMRIL